MNNKQLDALIRDGADVMASMGEGLYFRLARGTPSWVVKYTLGGKRSQISLPNAYPTLSIVQAKQTALEIRSDVKLGIDPKSERKKATFKEVRTVNDLFEDWHQSYIVPNFKNPQIPARYYHKEMKRHIGVITVKDVTPHHIRAVINEVTLSGRKTVANKTLMYARQMFNHAVKLNLINFNPAMAFTFKDAGGPEQPRSRTLGLPEIHYVFSAFRNHQQIFTRDNYLAACLLMCLGCRKGELIAARWDQFDFEEMVWQCLPNKKRFNMEVQPIVIPLPKLTLQWFQELKIRSCGSEYVFPSRRSSQRRGYISDDTLNHALAKMLGMKVDGGRQPNPNYLREIAPFTIHDLRRTFRSLLSEIGIPEHIAERCLNHKLKGVVGVYDRHDYLSERREALEKLSQHLEVALSPPNSKVKFPL